MKTIHIVVSVLSFSHGLMVSLTQSIIPLVIVMLAPAATQVLEDHGNVTEDDERWRENGALMEGHNELVALELPNLVGDGLHLEECVTVTTDRNATETVENIFNALHSQVETQRTANTINAWRNVIKLSIDCFFSTLLRNK